MLWQGASRLTPGIQGRNLPWMGLYKRSAGIIGKREYQGNLWHARTSTFVT